MNSPLLTCENLTLSVNDRVLIRTLSFDVNLGERIAVLGANGTGKTTLLKSLLGLTQYSKASSTLSSLSAKADNPEDFSGFTGSSAFAEDDEERSENDEGQTEDQVRAKSKSSILLNGKPITEYSRKKLAQHIGYLNQAPESKFPCTVRDAVLLGRHPWQSAWQTHSQEEYAQVDRILKQLSLEHLSAQNILTLSGGERQRVAIATLLTQNPLLYLLDEPINHLDLHHQINTLNFFSDLCHKQQHAFILVLHDVNLALRFCDKALLLFADGSWQFGPSSTLINAANLEKLYQHEFIPAPAHYWAAN